MTLWPFKKSPAAPALPPDAAPPTSPLVAAVEQARHALRVAEADAAVAAGAPVHYQAQIEEGQRHAEEASAALDRLTAARAAGAPDDEAEAEQHRRLTTATEQADRARRSLRAARAAADAAAARVQPARQALEVADKALRAAEFTTADATARAAVANFTTWLESRPEWSAVSAALTARDVARVAARAPADPALAGHDSPAVQRMIGAARAGHRFDVRPFGEDVPAEHLLSAFLALVERAAEPGKVAAEEARRQKQEADRRADEEHMAKRNAESLAQTAAEKARIEKLYGDGTKPYEMGSLAHEGAQARARAARRQGWDGRIGRIGIPAEATTTTTTTINPFEE